MSHLWFVLLSFGKILSNKSNLPATLNTSGLFKEKKNNPIKAKKEHNMISLKYQRRGTESMTKTKPLSNKYLQRSTLGFCSSCFEHRSTVS